MLIVQIYVVDAQPLEGGVTGLVDVLRPPIDAQPSAVRAAHVAELRGQDHPVAAAPDRPAHELLVGERAVHVRGVEKRDTELERAVNRSEEHTSELQSQSNLVCRLLLEKKNSL